MDRWRVSAHHQRNKKPRQVAQAFKNTSECCGIKFDCPHSYFITALESNLLFVNVISLVTKPGFSRDVCLPECWVCFISRLWRWSQRLKRRSWTSMTRCGCHLCWEEVQIVLIHSWPRCWMSLMEIGSGAAALEVLEVQLSGKPLPHAGWGSAPRQPPATCVLNCQGVIVAWWGSALLHLCLYQVYYQTKYSRVHKLLQPFIWLRRGGRTCAGCPSRCTKRCTCLFMYLFGGKRKVMAWIVSLICGGPAGPFKISFSAGFPCEEDKGEIKDAIMLAMERGQGWYWHGGKYKSHRDFSGVGSTIPCGLSCSCCIWNGH